VSLKRGYLNGLSPLSQSGNTLELTEFVITDTLYLCLKGNQVKFETAKKGNQLR
jgi:hypothetical protein